jgi:hypothetical protein
MPADRHPSSPFALSRSSVGQRGTSAQTTQLLVPTTQTISTSRCSSTSFSTPPCPLSFASSCHSGTQVPATQSTAASLVVPPLNTLRSTASSSTAPPVYSSGRLAHGARFPGTGIGPATGSPPPPQPLLFRAFSCLLAGTQPKHHDLLIAAIPRTTLFLFL